MAIHAQMKLVLDDWKQSKRVSDQDYPGWENALYEWRLPYWDWAQPQGYINDFGIPEICTLDRIAVRMPDLPAPNNKAFVKNGLTGFTNPKKRDGKPIPMGDKEMGRWQIKDDDNLPVSVLRVLKNLY